MNTARDFEVLKGLINNDQAWQLFLQSRKMEAVGSLAGGLAHDFNNILTSIHASAQYLRLSGDLSEDAKEAIDDIENQVICGAEVVKQLLLFSKPKRDKQSDVTLLNKRIRTFRSLLKRIMPKRIVIVQDLSESEISVRISASELEQILLNLLINARDAMPDGGTIKICSRVLICDDTNSCPIPGAGRGTYVKLEVSDSGKGIASKNISRIFEPYYSSKHEKGGTGLGLAIVYSIIQRHKGYIMVSSSDEGGTTFTIFLPARVVSGCEYEEKESDLSRFLGGGETVLLVDDEPIIAKSTAHVLERYGYKVLTATNGKGALAAFRRRKDREIDLIILDLEMPEMDGPSCLQQILDIDSGAKVISMSGHFIKPDVWDPIKAGAKAFLQKPFDSDTLLRTIRSVVNAQSDQSLVRDR